MWKHVVTEINVSHGCGFPSSVVSQERRDLPFVEVNVETADGRTRATIEHFDQVLNLDSHREVHWVGLEEQLT